jgi:hypothetical protein
VPSTSAQRFVTSIDRPSVLLNAASAEPTTGRGSERRQVYYHAALAALVASWDAYICQIVIEFFDTIADPLNPPFHALHSSARSVAENSVKRFNTPNWDASRELLAQHTGFDPINSWAWHSRGLGVQQTKERLNQILRVRHSFAHGFDLPPYSWTQDSSGRKRLTREGVYFTEKFFRHLVRQTDGGMKQHIESRYPVRTAW